MNRQFLQKMRALVDKCVEKTNALPKPLSMIEIVVDTTSRGLKSGRLVYDKKNCHDFLELIVENHIDNRAVMERILGTEIIKTAAKLYSQIKKDNQV